jgi:hypothetical protein
MIKADLVFKNVEGQVVPLEHINSMPHHEFFSAWAKGELRRDVEVTLEDPEAVEKGLKDFTSPEFQLVGGEIYDAWNKLDMVLLLPHRFLAHWQDTNPGSELKVHEADSPVIAPEVKEVKLGEGHIKYYSHYYWLTAQVAHEQQWYARDPQTVVYDMILELLHQWTMRDNATLLLLMSRSVREEDEPDRYEALTPNSFANLLTLVSRWAIPVPHCIVTAKVLADLDNPDWPRFCTNMVNQPEDGPAGYSHGRIMDIDTFCIGAPTDAFYPESETSPPDFYMCGMPSQLGVRAIKVETGVKSLEIQLLNEEKHGWIWSTYIGTAVLNSKAVSTAHFGQVIDNG